MSPPLLEVRELDVVRGERLLCRRLDWQVRRGERWAILGLNGAGKTTLLQTLAGLLPFQQGEVRLGGESIREMKRRGVARRVGLLFQDELSTFPTTVWESVLGGRHPHLEFWQTIDRESEQIARAMLKRLELDGMEERLVQTLSGGERKRLAIATLLCQQADLLLLDEPTNHLDPRHQAIVLKELAQLAGEGVGTIMVVHEPNLALHHCDHALLLFPGGEWRAGSCRELIRAETLTKLYDQPMSEITLGEERYIRLGI